MGDTGDQLRCSRTAWWQHDGALYRFLIDLLISEAQFLRPGGPVPPVTAFQLGAMLGEAGLGFDSLECMALAAALSEALFLHESGLDSSLVVSTRLGDWHDAVMAALDRFCTRVCFRSSGSTGVRKRSVHSLADLDAEVAFFAEQVANCRRIVVTVPCNHIYGFLFSLMLPARLDVPVVDMRNRFPNAVAAALQANDLVIGHPGFWAELSRAVPTGWSRDVVGVTSGAPCPDDVAKAVRSAGLSRLIQVYGSSETAGIGWRDDCSAPYKLLPHWRQLGEGILSRCCGKRGLEAPDRLRWLDAEHFLLEGRHDAAVQVGSHNVHLGRVRGVLCEHPAVTDVAVRLMASHEGERLKAFIVPSDLSTPHDALRRELHSYAATRLTIAERPRAFSFGQSVPKTAAGKPADWSIAVT